MHRVNSDTALLFKQLGLLIKAAERRLRSSILLELSGDEGPGGSWRIEDDQLRPSSNGSPENSQLQSRGIFPVWISWMVSSLIHCQLDLVQETTNASREWAAWAPGLVAALKKALKIFLYQRDQCLPHRNGC